MKKVVEASMSIALGVKLSRVEVIPMYPITSQTHIVEHLAQFINDGEMPAKMIPVESEHSACSAMIGSVLTEARTFTASCSQGIALMHEILPIISGMRLPAVMAVTNRALSAPINIWNDHSDSVSERDQGWIQLYVESSQEALDTVIQAFKISEKSNILLPVMVCLDGFTLSHVWEPVDLPEQSAVDKFLPKLKLKDTLDVNNPKSFGPIGFPNSFMEFKQQTHQAMLEALKEIVEVNNEFKKAFGRGWGNGLIEEYKMNDAKFAVMAMGSVCGTARVAVDKLRKKGVKAGLIKLKCLRPFPVKDIQKACSKLNGLSVIDRHISLGFEGPLFSEARSVLCNEKLQVNGYIAGLGGRDVTIQHIEKTFNDLLKKKTGGWLL